MKKLFIVAAIAAVVCTGWFASETHSLSGDMQVAEKMVG
ncbi:phosphatase [Bacillus haynesii]|nr:phosphatase [Bacillus haynesii]MCY7816374.1 phosphatase [Bacillus haynesii]MCY8223317.1 phosphatase [Bacillus haynesii]MCY8240601.1 phosphatase [Bacillus haynesii]MCY8369319.1 phosphatase [Bacillus haynesii]MCY8566506.1 phosphatase [Bacillus haynesii]